MSSSSDDEFYDCISEPIKYYAVACQKNKGSGLVTTDINEAKKKVKNTKGSRFNSFYNILQAQKFSECYLQDDIESNIEKKSKLPKLDADPFSNVSVIDVNNFKDAIEKGDVEKCQSLISNNPRYLVTACDYPTILRTSRFHYNALHVATACKQPKIVRLILDNLSQDNLWKTLHPTADDRCNKDRMNRVIDMYLNSPDFWNRETPLHFAAKFGCDECLRALLSQGLTDTNQLNKDNCRAEDIICTRYSGAAVEEKIAQMRDIFSEKYVVLLDGVKVKVPEPVSHCQLLTLLRTTNDKFRESHPDSCGDVSFAGEHTTVRAYIGPLQEIKARQLRCRWAVLNAEDAIKFEQTRRKDAEKGMECHGRYLAQLFGAPWREYWPFLDCLVDLGEDDGLSKLEEHLATCEATGETSTIDGPDCSLSAMDEAADTSKLHWAYSSLVRLFSRLTLNDSQRSPSRSVPSFIAKTPLRQPIMDSLRSKQTPFNTSVLGRGVLTPTDRQVRQAVLASGHDRHSRYPHVTSWLNELSAVDPDCDLNVTGLYSSVANGSMVTSTPLRQRPKSNNNHLMYSLQSQSPLSKIALPD